MCMEKGTCDVSLFADCTFAPTTAASHSASLTKCYSEGHLWLVCTGPGQLLPSCSAVAVAVLGWFSNQSRRYTQPQLQGEQCCTIPSHLQPNAAACDALPANPLHQARPTLLMLVMLLGFAEAAWSAWWHVGSADLRIVPVQHVHCTSAAGDDLVELEIKVGGMMCGGCTSRVEEALQKAPNVAKVQVCGASVNRHTISCQCLQALVPAWSMCSVLRMGSAALHVGIK
jgi:hypothetical protein